MRARGIARSEKSATKRRLDCLPFILGSAKKKEAFATASSLSNLALVEFGNPLFVSLQLLGFRSPYAHYDTCGSLWLVAIIGFSVRIFSPNQLNEWCSLPISQLIFGSFKGTSCTDFLSNDFGGEVHPLA